MRAVAQRVGEASVTVTDELVGRIDRGLLVYLGVARDDGPADAAWMAQKLAGLRIFEDEHGKMSRSVRDVGGQVLLVSQFTLFGDARSGLRPSFDGAAPPDAAIPLLEAVRTQLVAAGLVVATGRFRAEMIVRAEVLGPVTILLDSKKTF
jgi:D-aminoacyl-tRNA deacylase